MDDSSVTSPGRFISFDCSGLLMKGGFGDGDMLDNLLAAAGYGDRDRAYRHLVLCRVVEELVVPRLDQEVLTYRCDTGHNPARAVEVDGELVTWSDGSALPWVRLEPEEVEVEVASILAIASQVAAAPENTRGVG